MDRVAGTANHVSAVGSPASLDVWLQIVGSRVPQEAARAKSCGGNIVVRDVDLLEYIIEFLF